ncbi:hypothetical protein [Rhizobium bangladeshense]|uniref:hypothetical protein n=1 Tax=Rhizobium bangladeshense TaxID=1138189 RepID=UPI0021B11E24|nr:hypothetical protein [Rhizobium bangladeshense]
MVVETVDGCSKMLFLIFNVQVGRRFCEEFVQAIALEFCRCIVCLQNCQRDPVTQQHRHRIGFEQFAEPDFALFELGDIDTHAYSAAIGRASIIVSQPAPVAKLLLFLRRWLPKCLQTLLQLELFIVRNFRHFATG